MLGIAAKGGTYEVQYTTFEIYSVRSFEIITSLVTDEASARHVGHVTRIASRDGINLAFHCRCPPKSKFD